MAGGAASRRARVGVEVAARASVNEHAVWSKPAFEAAWTRQPRGPQYTSTRVWPGASLRPSTVQRGGVSSDSATTPSLMKITWSSR